MNVNPRTSDVWDFKKDRNGGWHWQRQSLSHELIQEGHTSFARFEDCVADAQRCGYSGSFALPEGRLDTPSRTLRRTRR